MVSAIVGGLVVGLIAKMLMPGKDPGGWIITIILGMAGAFVASLIGQGLGLYAKDDPAGWVASVLGAILLLALYRWTLGRERLT